MVQALCYEEILCDSIPALNIWRRGSRVAGAIQPEQQVAGTAEHPCGIQRGREGWFDWPHPDSAAPYWKQVVWKRRGGRRGWL